MPRDALQIRVRVESIASDLKTLTAVLADGTQAEVEELIDRNAQLLRELAGLVHRRRGGALVLALCSGSSFRGR